MYIVVVTVRSPTLGNPSLTCQFCLPKLAHLELSCIPESEDAWFYHQQKQGPNTLAPPGETSEFIQHQTFQPGVHRLLRGLGSSFHQSVADNINTIQKGPSVVMILREAP